MAIPHLPRNASLMLSIFYPAMLCCPFSKLTAPERVISAFQKILPPKQGRSIFRISVRIFTEKKKLQIQMILVKQLNPWKFSNHPAKFNSSTPAKPWWFERRFGVQGAAGWTMTPAVCSRRHSLKSAGWKDNANVPDRGLRCK